MLVAIEKQRYRLKGTKNTLIALTSFLALTSVFLEVGRIIWPHKVEDRANFVFLGGFILAVGTYIICFLIHLPGYLGYAAYQKYQINKSTPRPWSRKEWSETLTKTIKNVGFNMLVVMPSVMWLTTHSGVQLRFEGFPSIREMLMHLMFLYFMDDTITYLTHRAFHEVPSLYTIHKVHHENHSVFTWANIYTHPIELIFANLVSLSSCRARLLCRC